MDTKEFFNAMASNWDANELSTQEELYAFLLSHGVKDGKKTLDLGCGTGIISGILSDMGCTVTGLDLSENMIALAKKKHEGKGIRFESGNFYTFDESGFEQVVIFNAYPHFMDKQGFADRLYRVLKKDGEFIILHNIGRKQLCYHHRHVTDISCSLLPAEEEAEYFKGKFEIIEAYDTENSYLIRGKKYGE